MNAKLAEQNENNFKYHAPNDDTAHRYQALRSKAKEYADLINELVPDSREKSCAITKIEEASMWANAGVARNL